jgi:hypothetical protein
MGLIKNIVYSIVERYRLIEVLIKHSKPYMLLCHICYDHDCTVGYATTNDATTNECYNELFL